MGQDFQVDKWQHLKNLQTFSNIYENIWKMPIPV